MIVSNEVTLDDLVEVLHEIADGVSDLVVNTHPQERKLQTQETEPHPLGHLSKEEVAIILAVRGDINSKKEASRRLGVSYPTVFSWKTFCRTLDSMKAGDRTGSLHLGMRQRGGGVDGIVQNHCNERE